MRFEFDVICMWDLAADDVLAGGRLGVLPFVPFTRGATTGHVEQAMSRLARVEPVRRRGELQAALAAFADNIFPDVDWAGRVPEGLLMGSTVYQRGELAGQRKLLARQLTKRLGKRAEALVARTQLAAESVLVQASDLLAEKLSDDELLERLGKILPGESEGK